MKRIIILLVFLILYIAAGTKVFAETIGVIGTDVDAYAGSGSREDPFHYLFDSSSKVTWKHLGELKTQGITEVYENREGNTKEGKLLYSWTFTSEEITIPEGPYFLGINFYDNSVDYLPGGGNAFYFSFACKRDFPGTATVSIFVGNKYADGSKLDLYYYGGYHSTVVHNSSPTINKDEIYEVDEVRNIAQAIFVKSGYITFRIQYGGNYFLTDDLMKQLLEIKNTDIMTENNVEAAINNDSNITVTDTPDNSSKVNRIASAESNSIGKEEEANYSSSNMSSDIRTEQDNHKEVTEVTENINDIKDIKKEETVYTQDISLGKINEIFPTKGIADAIAGILSKQVTDQVSQAELNGIKRLYLDSRNLTSIDELAAITFERLETLIISNNELNYIPKLCMPMLSYIDLSNNNIVDVTSLSELQSLQIVLLKKNQITTMPDIAILKQLVSIDISDNKLTSFPGLASESLVSLNVSNNKLTHIQNLDKFPNLEFLDISSNCIKKLPDFTICKKLNEIKTKQNVPKKTENNWIAYAAGLIFLFILFVCSIRKGVTHFI